MLISCRHEPNIRRACSGGAAILRRQLLDVWSEDEKIRTKRRDAISVRMMMRDAVEVFQSRCRAGEVRCHDSLPREHHRRDALQ